MVDIFDMVEFYFIFFLNFKKKDSAYIRKPHRWILLKRKTGIFVDNYDKSNDVYNSEGFNTSTFVYFVLAQFSLENFFLCLFHFI